MRKKIPSKVIRSVPLNDGPLFEPSYEIAVSNHNQIHSSEGSGRFSYTWKLQKVQVSYLDTFTAQLLDSYV